MTKQNETNPTKTTNMVLIGMTAGALLLGAYNAGVNSGLIPTSNETKTEAMVKQNTVAVKQMSMKLAQTQVMVRQNQQQTMKAVKNDTAQDNPAYTDGKYVYEKFQVSDIVENDVNAEPLVGTGEGVHFTMNELFDHGLDSVFNEDVIEVGWLEKDYQENNWDKIAVVKKISSSEDALNAQN
jgi:hypothetical protein